MRSFLIVDFLVISRRRRELLTRHLYLFLLICYQQKTQIVSQQRLVEPPLMSLWMITFRKNQSF